MGSRVKNAKRKGKFLMVRLEDESVNVTLNGDTVEVTALGSGHIDRDNVNKDYLLMRAEDYSTVLEVYTYMVLVQVGSNILN